MAASLAIDGRERAERGEQEKLNNLLVILGFQPMDHQEFKVGVPYSITSMSIVNGYGTMQLYDEKKGQKLVVNMRDELVMANCHILAKDICGVLFIIESAPASDSSNKDHFVERGTIGGIRIRIGEQYIMQYVL